jgi:hypothetical protein
LRPDQRIVTKLPLTELWDETGALNGESIRHLDESLIRELMRAGQVQFIVADCGAKLNWIPTQERFEFWKTVRPQIAAQKPIYLERFPNQTAMHMLPLRVARTFRQMLDFVRDTPLIRESRTCPVKATLQKLV